jgi:hypothetical protein
MQTETMEQTVDTAGTEAKEQREPKQERQKQEGKREGKRAKGTIDWNPVKRDWNRGLSVAEIARIHNLETSTIYAQASRHKWTKRQVVLKSKIETVDPKEIAQKAVEKRIEKEIQAHAPAITNAVRERLNGWFEKVLLTSGKLQVQIDNMVEGRLEAEEIKTLSSSLETVDRIARRTFGLDAPSGSPVSVFSVSAPTITCPVIDVETIPEATPASVPQ